MAMDAVRRIARNTISLSIAELVGKLGHFFIFVYIARAMGNVIFGTFNFAYAFSLIAVVFTDIGINYMLIREVSKHRNKIGSYIGNSFLIKFMFSIITFIIVIATMNAGNFPDSTKAVVYLILAYMILRTLCDLLFTVFKAYESMHYEALIKFLNTIVLVIFIFFVIFQNLGIMAVSITYVAVQSFVFILTFILVIKKFTKISFRFDSGLSKEIIKKASPFTLSLIFAGIYFYIDSIMLLLIKGDAAVGLYSAAYNITLAILVIPGMYTYAIYPILSRKYATNILPESNKTVKLIYERSFKYLYVIGLPISIGLFVLARQIIVFIYGEGYYGSAIALQILAWFVFMKFLSYLTGIVLSSIDKQYLRMYSQGFSAFVNVGANLILIPRYGIVGAGIATLFSEFILFISSHYYVSKYFHKIKIKNIILKPIIASAAMYAAVYFTPLPTLFRILVGIAVYSIVVLALKYLDKQDIIFVKKLIPNKEVQRLIPYEE